MNGILSEIILELVKWNWFDRVALILSTLTVWILFLTYKWVKKYTMEAKIQTTELIKQRVLSSLPSMQTRFEDIILVPCSASSPYLRAKLMFRNIGNGTAINVILKSVVFKQQEKLSLEKPDPDLSRFLFLPNQEESPVLCFHSYMGLKEIPYTKEQVRQCWGNGEITITLFFQDIMGDVYEQKNKIIDGRYFQGPAIMKPSFGRKRHTKL